MMFLIDLRKAVGGDELGDMPCTAFTVDVFDVWPTIS